MITGVAHICFNVRDLDASLGFYRDRLGMKLAFEFKDDDGQRFGVYLHAGARTFVELFTAEAAEQAPNQSYQHFCLEVDDIEETVEELRSRGVEVTDIKKGMDQSWQAWLADPDGNQIELHQYTPESWQLRALG